MINLNNVKSILQVAGISQLKIQFNDVQQHVNADYVFKGKPGTKRITYQEVIDSLTIGMPGPPAEPGAALAAPRVDGSFELKDLPGENENNGLERA